MEMGIWSVALGLNPAGISRKNGLGFLIGTSSKPF